MSDEVHFHLGGYVNKLNIRIWGSENPKIIIEKPFYPQYVTDWCGFWAGGIIGTYFYENKAGAAVLLNGLRYRTIRDTQGGKPSVFFVKNFQAE